MNLEDKAWDLGTEYARRVSLASLRGLDSQQMYRDAIAAGCDPYHFDVFKYSAQAEWRRAGQLQSL